MRKTTEELAREAGFHQVRILSEANELETFRRLVLMNEWENAEAVAYYAGRNQFGSPVFRISDLPIAEGPLFSFPPAAPDEVKP